MAASVVTAPAVQVAVDGELRCLRAGAPLPDAVSDADAQRLAGLGLVSGPAKAQAALSIDELRAMAAERGIDPAGLGKGALRAALGVS
jgi:hypothetical protein